jgi:uncharacterized protein YbaP (TraB family)
MKTLVISVLCNLIVVLSAVADTSVWKIQSNGTVTYLGGTCHVLRRSDYPLPKEFETAYADSSVVVFEADIRELSQPETLDLIMRRSTYNDGSRLDNILSARVYGMLKKYCEEIGFPIASLHLLRPSLAVFTLVHFEFQRLGINQTGVDHYFYDKAMAESKQIGVLETVEEQIQLVVSMGEGNEDDFIEHSVHDLRRMKQMMKDLIAAWRAGDENKLDELFVDQMRRDYPNIYQQLLVERNLKWLPKLIAYTQTPEKEFVLVGAGHLVGEDGIIEHLRRRGYTIDKFQ